MVEHVGVIFALKSPSFVGRVVGDGKDSQLHIFLVFHSSDNKLQGYSEMFSANAKGLFHNIKGK